MVKIVFTQNLQLYINQPPLEFDTTDSSTPPTVGSILASVFAENPRLGHYCVDDQGAPRDHIAIFVAGKPIRDRQGLSDAVSKNDEIYVMQALSGG
ncbi:MAG: molybdopterin synthase sulfur carrier subunit [Pirellulaceae bacterium]|jgi:molybdopterin synthase sulfur carrier subunit